MEKKRLFYPDILRALCASIVVLIHCLSVMVNSHEIGLVGKTVCSVLNTNVRWAVPVFFMISGIFFLDPSRKISFTKLWYKTIPNLLLKIVVWGFIYSLLTQFLYSSLSVRSIVIAILEILSGNAGYHLWFLYALLSMYICVPIFRIITENATKSQLEYILLVWFVLFICVGNINSLVSEYTALNSFIRNDLYVITSNAGYFLLGYYLHKYALQEKWYSLIWKGALICLYLTSMITVILLKKDSTISLEPLLSVHSISNCLTATTVFVFLKNKADMIEQKRICKCVIDLLASQSFGIYLLHPLWIFVFTKFLTIEIFRETVFIIPLFTVVLLASLLCSMIISKIAIINKLV